MFDLATCARPNILKLKPYRCARDDFKDDGTNTLLDANENALGPGIDVATIATGEGLSTMLRGLNRYPDPHQNELKQLFCNLRNNQTQANGSTESADGLKAENLFVGVGSDEAIDSLIRCFCKPGGQDKIVVCPPTYGMYRVSADINDVGVLSVPLLSADENFQLDVPAIEKAIAENIESVKLLFVCSPGNPTGSLLSRSTIEHFLNPERSSVLSAWNGVVVVDEAYVDFSPPGSSMAPLVRSYPNLVVMQTLSKAFGLAGLRIGVAFADPDIAALMNALKAPYNVCSPSSALATAALSDPAHLEVSSSSRTELIRQRDLLVSDLGKIDGVGRVRGGLDANFVLVEILDRLAGPDSGEGLPSSEVAQKVYSQMATSKRVVVRNRASEHGCQGCLRITVGSEADRLQVCRELKAVLAQVLSKSKTE